MTNDGGTRSLAIRLAERLGISVPEAERILSALASLTEDVDHAKPAEPRRVTGFGYDGAFDLPADEFDKVSSGEE